MYILLRQGENDPEPIFHSTYKSLADAAHALELMPNLHPEGRQYEVLFQSLQIGGLFGVRDIAATEVFRLILVGSTAADLGRTYGGPAFDPPAIVPTDFYLFNLGLYSRSRNAPSPPCPPNPRSERPKPRCWKNTGPAKARSRSVARGSARARWSRTSPSGGAGSSLNLAGRGPFGGRPCLSTPSRKTSGCGRCGRCRGSTDASRAPAQT